MKVAFKKHTGLNADTRDRTVPYFGSWIVAVLVLLVGFGVAFRETFRLIDLSWREGPSYDHGYLVLLIAGWLVLRSLRSANNIVLRPNLVFLLPLALVSFSYTVGIDNLNQVSLPVMMVLSLGTIFGKEIAQRVFVPVMFLHFALPGWGVFQPWLQDMTVWATTSALRLVHIPVFIEGTYVTLPAGQFVIEEGCSGLKYFVVGATISSLVAYLYAKSWQRRIGIVLLGVSLSIIGNWIRVFMVIVAGHVTEMQHPWVHDHLSLGWYIFAFMLVPFFVISGYLEDRHAEPAAKGGKSSKLSGAVVRKGQSKAKRDFKFALASLAGVTALSVGPLAESVMASGCSECRVNLVMPAGTNGWSTGESYGDFWRPTMAGAASEQWQVYRRDGHEVSLYIAIYGGGAAKAEMVNAMNIFEDRRIWQFVNHETSGFRIGDKVVKYNDLMLSRASNERYVGGYWYEVNGITSADRNKARLSRLLGPFTSETYEGLVAFSVRCAPACDEAARVAGEFFRDNYADVHRVLMTAVETQKTG